MKKLKTSPENSKAHTFTTVEELITITNEELDDTLYIADDIFIPEKKNIWRCYWTDFSLKTLKEAYDLVKKKLASMSPKYKQVDFFVYNESTHELLPFKKNDYMIYENGYFTFDGTNYISYDDMGHEVSRFSYIDDKEPNIEGIFRHAA